METTQGSRPRPEELISGTLPEQVPILAPWRENDVRRVIALEEMPCQTSNDLVKSLSSASSVVV